MRNPPRPRGPWVAKQKVLVALQIGPQRLREIQDQLPLRRLELPGLPSKFHGDDLAALVANATKAPAGAA